ncbi:hypothetical protein SDC9_143264 [bioreactor metagenome]|uniref:Uncharacterized protein n=1 Tax=bioreactor metagenome TaxID=1076179 RepID=A0A645E329_9ZZZZ
MKIAVGIRRAVGGDEQLCAVKVRGVNRSELNLNRPLVQAGRRFGDNRSFFCSYMPLDAAGMRTRAAAGKVLGRLGFVGFNGRFVVCGGFAFNERDRTGRTLRQAVAEPVAIIVAQQFSFAVDHADRSFMAGLGARAAAVALIFVYMNNLSDHCS